MAMVWAEEGGRDLPDPTSLGLCVNQQRTLDLLQDQDPTRQDCVAAVNDNPECTSIYLYDIMTHQCSCVPSDGSYAEKVYFNGHIYTFDEDNTQVEAVVVKDGNIVFTGTNADALANEFVTDATTLIDLEGKFVLPGFIDPHSHVADVGLQQQFANVLPKPDGTSDTFDLLVENMINWANNNTELVNKTGVIFGMGYDEALIKNGKPDRHVLDRVSTELPVFMTHISMHGMVMNTKALEFFNYTNYTMNSEGGTVWRHENASMIERIQEETGDYAFRGNPSGVMEEVDIRKAYFHLLTKMADARMQQMFVAMDSYAQYGYTTIQQGMWLSTWADILPEMADKDLFYLDTVAYIDAFQSYANMSKIAMCDPERPEEEFYTNKFRCGGAKISFDGSPQMKTAWTRDPYLSPPVSEDQDEPWYGFPQHTDENAYKFVSTALNDGFQVLVHANGDRAVQQLIEVVRNYTERHGPLFDENGEKTQMVVGIHNQIMGYDQVLAYDELGIFPALFSMHTFYWGDWHMNETFGDPRASVISRSADFLETVGYFTSHHDAPVGGPDAWRVLSAAITRRTRTNVILGANETVSIEDAIRSTTDWAALQYLEQEMKGTLEVGKMADMVVMNDDIFAVDLEDENIRDIIWDLRLELLQTIKQGNVVYGNEAIGAEPKKYDFFNCGVYNSIWEVYTGTIGAIMISCFTTHSFIFISISNTS